jgi:hypothetical protein
MTSDVLEMTVTRTTLAMNPHNHAGRNVFAGETVYLCRRATYGCLHPREVALTFEADGGYPFFGFPADAVDPA